MNLSEIRTRVYERLVEDGADPGRWSTSFVDQTINDGVRHAVARTGCQLDTQIIIAEPYKYIYDLESDVIDVHRITRATTNEPLTGISWREADGSLVDTTTQAAEYSWMYKRFDAAKLILLPPNAPPSATFSTIVVFSEVPSGTMDSANTDFTLTATPATGRCVVFYNGVRLKPVAASPGWGQFTISGTTITLGMAPDSGDTLLVDYTTTAASSVVLNASFDSGTQNGTNKTFFLTTAIADVNSIAVYINGIRLTDTDSNPTAVQFVKTDIGTNVTQVNLGYAPAATDYLVCDYRTSAATVYLNSTPSSGANSTEFILTGTPGTEVAAWYGGARIKEVALGTTPTVGQFTLNGRVLRLGSAITGAALRLEYAPIVSGDAETYHVLYTQDTGDTPLSSDTDAPVFAKRFHEMLVDYTQAHCLMTLGDEKSVQRATELFADYFARMKKLGRTTRSSLDRVEIMGAI